MLPRENASGAECVLWICFFSSLGICMQRQKQKYFQNHKPNSIPEQKNKEKPQRGTRNIMNSFLFNLFIGEYISTVETFNQNYCTISLKILNGWIRVIITYKIENSQPSDIAIRFLKKTTCQLTQIKWLECLFRTTNCICFWPKSLYMLVEPFQP